MNQQQNSKPKSPPRPFIYRSAEPEQAETHPLRRATDKPRSMRAMVGQIISPTVLLKFRVDPNRD